MVTVDIAFATPIPIGHQVELRWFEETSSGLFGTKEKDLPFIPLVKDLSTGIEYVSSDLYPHAGGHAPQQPLELDNELKPELNEIRTLRGEVTACRVIMVQWSDQSVQTRLWVKPEGSSA